MRLRTRVALRPLLRGGLMAAKLRGWHANGFPCTRINCTFNHAMSWGEWIVRFKPEWLDRIKVSPELKAKWEAKK